MFKLSHTGDSLRVPETTNLGTPVLEETARVMASAKKADGKGRYRRSGAERG